MKTHQIIALLLCAALTVCCSSDDSGPSAPLPVAKTHLIVKKRLVETSSETEVSSNEFSFDSSGRLAAELDAATTTNYSWDGSGRIYKATQSNGDITRETIYTYNNLGQLVTEEKRTVGTNALNYRNEYSYFTDHYETRYYDSANSYNWRYEFYYDAQKKNIALTKMYSSSGTYSGSLEHVYDNKRSIYQVAPYKQMPQPFYNANNMINQVERTADNSIMESVEWGYQTNADGYTTVQTQGSYATYYDYVVR